MNEQENEENEAEQAYTGKLHALFGYNLKRLRQKMGLSQLSLSGIAGLTHNFINDIEHGKKGVSFDTMAKLSAALKAPPHQFFLPKPSEPVEYLSSYPHINEFLSSITKAVEDFKTNYE
jgi:transcriptional regulator with XRE-family HTH domain